VKALYHRLCVAQNTNHYSKWNELHQEWQAILRSKAFGKSFAQWCQNMPELGPAPLAVPSTEYLHVMLQLLQHLTDIEIAFDAKLQKDRQAHARHLDRTYRGHATAYARIKEQTMPPVSQMKSQITEEAVVVPQPDGQLLAFCDNPKQFDMAATVLVQDCHSSIVAIDDYSVSLRTHQPLPPHEEELQLTQDRTHSDPQDILRLLTDYWLPFWNDDRAHAAAADHTWACFGPNRCGSLVFSSAFPQAYISQGVRCHFSRRTAAIAGHGHNAFERHIVGADRWFSSMVHACYHCPST